jgi:hypothetical protein
MLHHVKNLFSGGKYHTHPEAVIVSCYFNPMRSPYRLKAFKIFYESIRYLNHRIVECVIETGKTPAPTELDSIVDTNNYLGRAHEQHALAQRGPAQRADKQVAEQVQIRLLGGRRRALHEQALAH